LRVPRPETSRRAIQCSSSSLLIAGASTDSYSEVPRLGPTSLFSLVVIRWWRLPRPLILRNLKAMEVQFTPEQEAQLSQIATREGIDAERLVKDAALRLLEEDARFRAAVRTGIEQADRGEFIEEAEMDARLEQMLRS
jgi:predicted transcriptional regulator